MAIKMVDRHKLEISAINFLLPKKINECQLQCNEFQMYIDFNLFLDDIFMRSINESEK